MAEGAEAIVTAWHGGDSYGVAIAVAFHVNVNGPTSLPFGIIHACDCLIDHDCKPLCHDFLLVTVRQTLTRCRALQLPHTPEACARRSVR